MSAPFHYHILGYLDSNNEVGVDAAAVAVVVEIAYVQMNHTLDLTIANKIATVAATNDAVVPAVVLVRSVVRVVGAYSPSRGIVDEVVVDSACCLVDWACQTLMLSPK